MCLESVQEAGQVQDQNQVFTQGSDLVFIWQFKKCKFTLIVFFYNLLNDTNLMG